MSIFRCWLLTEFVSLCSFFKNLAEPDNLTIDEEGATVHGSYGGRLDLNLDFFFFGTEHQFPGRLVMMPRPIRIRVFCTCLYACIFLL